MGLSSSQARLLNLTSRMHQIEYKAAKLEAEKLQMANESSRVYEEYLEALEKTKIQRKILTTDGSITYRDLKDYQDFLNGGFALVSSASGTSVVYDDAADWATLLNDLGINKVNNFETTLTNIILSGEVTILSKDPKTNTFPTDVTSNEFVDNETSVATNTNLQEVSDESILKKAEAKYEADMKKIDRKDRKYDSDLAALEAERNAIKEEMETLKTVAKDNVDRTFKLFT